MREAAKAGDDGTVPLGVVELRGIAEVGHRDARALLVGQILAVLERQVEKQTAVGRQARMETGGDGRYGNPAGRRVAGKGAGRAAPGVAGKLVEQDAQRHGAVRRASPVVERAGSRGLDGAAEAARDQRVEIGRRARTSVRGRRERTRNPGLPRGSQPVVAAPDRDPQVRRLSPGGSARPSSDSPVCCANTVSPARRACRAIQFRLARRLIGGLLLSIAEAPLRHRESIVVPLRDEEAVIRQA